MHRLIRNTWPWDRRGLQSFLCLYSLRHEQLCLPGWCRGIFFDLLTARKQEERRRGGGKAEQRSEWMHMWVFVMFWIEMTDKDDQRSRKQGLQMRRPVTFYPFVFSIFLFFFTLSQELLRVREVPGELETNGGWHHDRTLHQSLLRLFGYLPRLRKNCYSFFFSLPGRCRKSLLFCELSL